MKARDLVLATELTENYYTVQKFKAGLDTWKGTIRISFGGYFCELHLQQTEIYEFIYLACCRQLDDLENQLTKLGIDLEPSP